MNGNDPADVSVDALLTPVGERTTLVGLDWHGEQPKRLEFTGIRVATVGVDTAYLYRDCDPAAEWTVIVNRPVRNVNRIAVFASFKAFAEADTFAPELIVRVANVLGEQLALRREPTS